MLVIPTVPKLHLGIQTCINPVFREIIDVFIPQAKKHLRKNGVLLLLITSLKS